MRILLIIFIAVFGGCQKAERVHKKELRLSVTREPPSMDPRLGKEIVGSTMHFLLFEGLTKLEADGKITLAQAKAVEVSKDRKTYTFHLRNTFWSDGTPVTAIDFEKAWKKILSPSFPASNAHLFYSIKNAQLAKKGEVPLDAVGVHAKDDKTFVVELENPTPYFLDLISFCVFAPVSHKVDESNPSWALETGPKFICNGPFTLKDWKHNNEIVFEKNPTYWNAEHIGLDQIQISMIMDENTALHMFESGELDMIGMGLSPIPGDALRKYRQMGQVKCQQSGSTTIVCFNVNKFPFNNKNIRKAFAYAINRKAIVENITELEEHIATSIVPPLLKKNRETSFFNDNDVDLARSLFQKGVEEIGAFPEITYNYSYSENNHHLAQMLQQQWQETLGVTVNLQNNENKILMDKLSSRNYEMAQTTWMAQYKDPMNILERFKYKTNVKNHAGWENPEFIRLLDKSATDRSEEERLATLEEAEALLLEEMPLAPIYHWKTAYMVKPYLSNTDYVAEGAFNYSQISIR